MSALLDKDSVIIVFKHPHNPDGTLIMFEDWLSTSGRILWVYDVHLGRCTYTRENYNWYAIYDNKRYQAVGKTIENWTWMWSEAWQQT